MHRSRVPNLPSPSLIGTEYRVSDALVFTNKFRDEHSILNYIGTLPEQGAGGAGRCNSTVGGASSFNNPNPAAWLVCLNPQSRFQVTDVLADEFLSLTESEGLGCF